METGSNAPITAAATPRVYPREVVKCALRHNAAATVRSQRQLAKELGVSQGTVSFAIRWRGQYKQLSPELRSKRRPAERLVPAGPDTEDEGDKT